MKREVKTSSYTLTVPLCRRWRPTCQNVCSCCKILMGTDVALRYCQTRAHAQTLSLSSQPTINTSNTFPSLRPSLVLPLSLFLFYFPSIFPSLSGLACPVCLCSCFLCLAMSCSWQKTHPNKGIKTL